MGDRERLQMAGSRMKRATYEELHRLRKAAEEAYAELEEAMRAQRSPYPVDEMLFQAGKGPLFVKRAWLALAPGEFVWSVEGEGMDGQRYVNLLPVELSE